MCVFFLNGVQNRSGKFLCQFSQQEQSSNSGWPENSFARVFPNSTAARLSSSSAKALHVSDRGAGFAQNLEFPRSIPKVVCTLKLLKSLKLSKSGVLPKAAGFFQPSFNLFDKASFSMPSTGKSPHPSRRGTSPASIKGSSMSNLSTPMRLKATSPQKLH